MDSTLYIPKYPDREPVMFVVKLRARPLTFVSGVRSVWYTMECPPTMAGTPIVQHLRQLVGDNAVGGCAVELGGDAEDRHAVEFNRITDDPVGMAWGNGLYDRREANFEDFIMSYVQPATLAMYSQQVGRGRLARIEIWWADGSEKYIFDPLSNNPQYTDAFWSALELRVLRRGMPTRISVTQGSKTWTWQNEDDGGDFVASRGKITVLTHDNETGVIPEDHTLNATGALHVLKNLSISKARRSVKNGAL